MFSWIIRPFQRRIYADNREKLIAAFHKNASDSIAKAIAGLELLTTPTTFEGNCIDLPLSGKLELRTPTFEVIIKRLEHSLKEYHRLSGSKRIEWIPFPNVISKDKDKFVGRWLDGYFNVTHPELLREDLKYAKALVKVLASLTQPNSSSDELEDILQRETAHIVRDINTIVEHYL